jgi:hypothetical protein
MRGQILTTSSWLHVEFGKNIKKILCQKIKLHLFFELQFFLIAFSLLRCPTTLLVKFRNILKIHPAHLLYFIKCTPMRTNL